MEQVIFDKDGTEYLCVERKKVLEYYKDVQQAIGEENGDTKIEMEGRKMAMRYFFGDKCLPDKEPSVQVEPKFKYNIGDLVTYKGKIKKVISRDLDWSGAIMYTCSLLNGQSPLRFEEECLEPYFEPKFKVGDKVRIIKQNHSLYGKTAIVDVPMKDAPEILVNRMGNLYSFYESELEPYTEPIAQNPLDNSNTGSLSSKSESMEEDEEEDGKKIVDNTISIAKEYFENVKINKDNMEEKELNLLNILSDSHIGETFYSLIEGYVKFEGIELHWEEYGMKPLRFAEGNFNPDGTYQTKPNASCCIWPSKELYEKYPLDAYSAWMEWKESREPKRWRAEKGEKYWSVNSNCIACNYIDMKSSFDDECYKNYNYFRTEEEAQQAAEAVRETLMTFHQRNDK